MKNKKDHCSGGRVAIGRMSFCEYGQWGPVLELESKPSGL